MIRQDFPTVTTLCCTAQCITVRYMNGNAEEFRCATGDVGNILEEVVQTVDALLPGERQVLVYFKLGAYAEVGDIRGPEVHKLVKVAACEEI